MKRELFASLETIVAEDAILPTVSAVCRVLDNMQKAYGEDRYRTSAWLRRKALTALPIFS